MMNLVLPSCHLVTLSPCHLVSRSRRGSVLLEVLVTVTIIAMFMALIGSQILAAIRAAGTIEHRQMALLLSESMISRLQAGGFSLDDPSQSQQLTGDFGTVYPTWGWQIDAEPTDDPNVFRVTLQVFEGEPGQVSSGLRDRLPAMELTTFQTVPRKIDLVADLGVSEQNAAALAATLGGLDPRSLDPRVLAHMNLTDLAQMVPQLGPLLSTFGVNLSDLGNLDTLRNTLSPLVNAGNNAGGNKGTNSNSTDDTNNGANQPGSVDFSELMRLAQSGDKQAMMDWIEAHKAELDAMAGSGQSNGGNNSNNNNTSNNNNNGNSNNSSNNNRNSGNSSNSRNNSRGGGG